MSSCKVIYIFLALKPYKRIRNKKPSPHPTRAYVKRNKQKQTDTTTKNRPFVVVSGFAGIKKDLPRIRPDPEIKSKKNKKNYNKITTFWAFTYVI